jgi:hypothetical protein
MHCFPSTNQQPEPRADNVSGNSGKYGTAIFILLVSVTLWNFIEHGTWLLVVPTGHYGYGKIRAVVLFINKDRSVSINCELRLGHEAETDPTQKECKNENCINLPQELADCRFLVK